MSHVLPQADNPPTYLPDDARQWWRPLVDEIVSRGHIKRVAVHRLAIYCQLFAQYHRVTRHLNEEGQVTVIRNDKGEVKAETVAAEAVQQKDLVKLLKAFDKEFGFLSEAQGPDPLETLRQKLSARLAGSAATHN